MWTRWALSDVTASALLTHPGLVAHTCAAGPDIHLKLVIPDHEHAPGMQSCMEPATPRLEARERWCAWTGESACAHHAGLQGQVSSPFCMLLATPAVRTDSLAPCCTCEGCLLCSSPCMSLHALTLLAASCGSARASACARSIAQPLSSSPPSLACRRVVLRDGELYVAALNAREDHPEVHVLTFPKDAHPLDRPQTQLSAS